MKKMVLIIFPVILLLSACALEIANVIGPGGVYVYYDKGNDKGGWRYKGCSSYDIGELKLDEFQKDPAASLEKAVKLCIEQSAEYFTYNWEIPDEADMKKMLECFSYGLTRFSPDYYYLSANKTSHYDASDPNSWNPSTWDVVILHKYFDMKNLNGKVENVKLTDEDGNPITINDSKDNPIIIRVRPIRKF